MSLSYKKVPIFVISANIVSIDVLAFTMGTFTNYVMHFSLLFDHPPTYGYGFAMILLNIYLTKFAMVIFC